MGDPNQRINYTWPEQSFLIIDGFLSLTVSVNILNLMLTQKITLYFIKYTIIDKD